MQKHNPQWSQIPNPNSILIVGGSGPGKTNALLNLPNHKQKIDHFFCMSKIHMSQSISIINKIEEVGLKHFSDPKAFIEYSNDMKDIED